MIKSLLLLNLSLSPFLFVSCEMNSAARINHRIDQNATLFHQKSVPERQMISHGEILPGMTRDAVFLAWGDPWKRYKGFDNDIAFEEWHYKKLSPSAKLGVGLGAGPGIGIEKDVAKIVRFEGGQVISYRSME